MFGKPNKQKSYSGRSYSGLSKHPRAVRNHRTFDSTTKSWLLFVCSGGLIATLIAAAVGLRPAPVDGENCVAHTVPPKAVAVFVDLTDQALPTPEQSNMLTTEIESLRDNLQTGDRLTILTLGSTGQDTDAHMKQVFSACKPKHPDEGDPFRESIVRLEKRYREQWEGRVREAIEEIISKQPHGTRNSPLMATFKEIAGKHYLRAMGPRTLVVFSDLLEHSHTLSHYGNTWPSMDDLRRKNDLHSDVKGILSGIQVSVRLWSSSETGRYHTPRHADYWAKWMKLAGAGYTVNRL
jgi:hypothetical protein